METFSEFNTGGNVPERSTGSVIAHAFEMYKGIILYAIAAVLIYALASSVASMFTGFDSRTFMEEVQSANGDFTRIRVSNIPGLTTYYTVSGIISILLMPIFVGLIFIANKFNSGKAISFGDLFIAYRQNFVQFLIYGLISTIIIGIAAALCFFPMFFVAPLVFLGYPIILFENATATQALSKSFNIAKQNYGTLLGISIVALLISVAGILLCGIGILLTFAFYYVAMYSAYCAFLGKPRPIL